MTIALAGILVSGAVVGCSSSTDRRVPASTGSSAPNSASAHRHRTAITIKTKFVNFDGKVVPGSVIGTEPFCPGGTLHHQAGSPEIGYPAINVFTCGSSELRIGFGPGPDQMNKKVQTSDWKVLYGSGDFAGVTGSGHMRVVFPSVGASRGRETFTGAVTVPD